MGYIHLVSPVKSAARNENISYYSMIIQTSEDLYRSVSCREDFRDQLLKVEKNKTKKKQEKNRCPIQLFNIKREMNFHDPSKTDIGINNKTELDNQDEIPFKFRKVSKDVCPLVTEEAVLKEKKHIDYVYLHCHNNIEDIPMVATTLRYKSRTIHKKDVACNDDTGTIKLTLLGSSIECIKKSGVYFM